jgi:dolichyl-phosphate beta-glucosyltransferase
MPPDPGLPELSLVIPVCDGERHIGRTLDAVAGWLARTGLSHEVLVVDDGSRDGTAASVEAARERHPAVRLLRHEANRGKGAAVRTGMLAARGRLRIFTDADLAYPPESLDAVLAALRAGAPVAVADRELPGSACRLQSGAPAGRVGRGLLGAAFRGLTAGLGLSAAGDTQAGLKGFSDAAATRLFALQRVAGYAFDVELLHQARLAGLEVARVPVVHFHQRGRGARRVLRDSLGMLRDLLAIRWHAWRGRYGDGSAPLPAALAAGSRAPPRGSAASWTRGRALAAWLAVLAAVLLRYAPLLSLDATFPHHDWLQVHQPDAEHVVRAARDGSLVPLWAPYLLGGSPLYAVATKPLSYPPFLLAPPLLGAAGAMNVLALLHVLLAAWGMLRLARRLGCGPAAGAAGAIVLLAGTWPGSLFKSQPFWAYAVAWWPWALHAALDVLEADRGRALVAAAARLGVSMALQVLAGGVFQAYWLACFLGVFALPFLLRRGDAAGGVRRAGALLLAAATCALLSAVRVLPALEWMRGSGRSGGLPEEDLLSGYDAIAAGADNAAWPVLQAMLFRGDRLGTWALVAGCLLAPLLSARRRVAWATLAGVLACVLVATGLPHGVLAAWLPGYDLMRLPYRFLAAAGLGGALLVALAADGLRARLPRALALAALAAGALLLALDLQLVPGWRWSRPSPDSMAELLEMAEPVAAALDDGSGTRLHAPHARFQTLWVARGLRSTAGVLGGAGSGSAAYAEWLPPGASPLELEARHRGVLDVLAVRWATSFEPLDIPWLTPVFEPRQPDVPAGAAPGRLRLDTLDELDPYDAYVVRNLRSPDGDAYRRPFAYRRAGALPHAALVERAVLVVGAELARAAAIREALDRRSFDAWATVFLEDPELDPAMLDEVALEGLASVLFAGADDRAPEPHALRRRAGGRLSPQPGGGVLWEPEPPRASGLQALDEGRVASRCNGLSIDVSGAAAPLLLLSETFTLHPGWSARVDGRPAALLRADGCISALRLPAGARRVEIEYWPPGLGAGLWGTAVGVLLLGGGAWWWRRRG